jgi:anti-sigma-K factor RskA
VTVQEAHLADDDDPTREYVLRALAASEIAETATRADLREAFTQLTETWLARAADAEQAPD